MMEAVQPAATGVRTRQRTQRQPPAGITFDDEDEHPSTTTPSGGFTTPEQSSKRTLSPSLENNNNGSNSNRGQAKIALEPKGLHGRKKTTPLNGVPLKRENDENSNINSINKATPKTLETTKVNTVTPPESTRDSGHVTSSSSESSPIIKLKPVVDSPSKHVRFNNNGTSRAFSPKAVKQEDEQHSNGFPNAESSMTENKREANDQSLPIKQENDIDSPSSKGARGAVSSRGRGVRGSGGSSSSSTYKSPDRPNKKQKIESSAENDSVVPSLVSAKSDLGSQADTAGAPSSTALNSSKDRQQGPGGCDSATTGHEDVSQQQQRVAGQKRKPYSITCDPSNIVASPLASNEEDSPSSGETRKKMLVNSSNISTTEGPAAPSTTKNDSRLSNKNRSTTIKKENDKRNAGPTTSTTEIQNNANTSGVRASRNVTFSPPPPSSNYYADGPSRRTPMRSPTGTGGQFHSLPSLQDPKLLQSPCNLFLSPYSPSAAAYQGIAGASSFDDGVYGFEGKRQGGDSSSKSAIGNTEEDKLSKARDEERARAVSTPTDFSLDFGKGHQLSASFDASNVLAWLQSPTAHGLFSPGGITSSAVNTPRGAYGVPRTPRTPTLSSSFFFSDVAGLPRNGEFTSPRPHGSPRQAGIGRGNGSRRAGTSGTMCMSPLSSKRNNISGRGIESQTNTPMNYKDIFASPRLPISRGSGGGVGSATIGGPRSLPRLGDSPTRTRGGSSGQRSASLDAVHMAERDLMEDEDLSVLLQLASHSNTPVKGAGGSHVFRSPRMRRPGHSRHPYEDRLQLPVIGDGEGSRSKLSRKTAYSGDHSDSHHDFAPPASLSIRSSSSGGSKEIYTAGSKHENLDYNKIGGNSAYQKPVGSSGPSQPGTKKPAKKPLITHPSAYAMPPGSHPPYPPHHGPGSDPVTYYPMPGSMPSMPPGGSMRVVVGGPPRPGSNSSSPPRGPNHSSPHRPHPYGIPSHHPPPGSYPHHSYPPHHPPPHHMSVPHPHYGHYPPHPGHQMHMYPGQHPPPPHKVKSQKGKQPKPTMKRPSPDIGKNTLPGGMKKPKKSPSKKEGGEKKPRKPKTQSPPLNDPVDRQKAAATIATINDASGGKNDKAAALAAAILRGVTMRPSGKWQAQLYYAGKSRYIGVFDTREKAALAYEIAREKLKSDSNTPKDQSAQSLKITEANVNAARKAAFDGVSEKDPRISGGHK